MASVVRSGLKTADAFTVGQGNLAWLVFAGFMVLMLANGASGGRVLLVGEMTLAAGLVAVRAAGSAPARLLDSAALFLGVTWLAWQASPHLASLWSWLGSVGSSVQSVP